MILEQYRFKALELENKRLVSVNAEILSQKEALNKKAEDLSSQVSEAKTLRTSEE